MLAILVNKLDAERFYIPGVAEHQMDRGAM
jgi:hypothetical protein